MLAKPEDITSAFAAFRKEEPKTEEPKKIEAKDTSVRPVSVTARLNYSAVGVCPYCNEPMGRVECCGQEVFYCEADRNVAPLPNTELS